MNIYNINYNRSKNRIHINFKDSLNFKETKQYVKELKKVIDKAQPHFTFCLDFSCDPVHSKKVDAVFKEARQYAIENKMKGTATILSKSILSKIQMRKTLKDLNNNIFDNRKEAAEYLDSL
ncbi:hypothetical protein JCM16358_24120 [Halanaerocella petrolearia]